MTRAPLRRIASIALLAGAAPAVWGGPPDRAAVPLRTPAFETPTATAGTGLAPELTVRVRIDKRGYLANVRVLKIDPSSSYDEAFESAARRTLSLWRFAPEIWEGKPIETELEWTIQFVPRERQIGGAVLPLAEAWTPNAIESRRADMWREILALPQEQRNALLDRITEQAMEQLQQGKARSYESDRFVVYTDAESPRAVEEIAKSLETTWDALDRIFGEHLTPRTDSMKIRAFVFASRDSFRRLTERAMSIEWLAGFYNPAGLLAFHLEQSTEQGLATLMLHEATHAWVDRRLLRQGVFLPRWLGEGFAEYVGNSVVKKSGLVPGKTPRAQIYRTGFGTAFLGRSEAAFTADEVMRILRSRDALTMEQILEADLLTFYGEDRVIFYAVSWLLVHFLRHGEESWAEREFPEFMLYVAEGYPIGESFTAVYGAEPASYQDAFRRYVNRF